VSSREESHKWRARGGLDHPQWVPKEKQVGNPGGGFLIEAECRRDRGSQHPHAYSVLAGDGRKDEIPVLGGRRSWERARHRTEARTGASREQEPTGEATRRSLRVSVLDLPMARKDRKGATNNAYSGGEAAGHKAKRRERRGKNPEREDDIRNERREVRMTGGD